MFNKNVVVVAATLVVLTVAGCSNKQMYNATQENRRNACMHKPPQEQQACLDDYQTSHEEYERSVKELEQQKRQQRLEQQN